MSGQASEHHADGGDTDARLTAGHGPLVVRNVLPGSPAQRAGLRPGDVVPQINGKSTDDMAPEPTALWLNGIRSDNGNVSSTFNSNTGAIEPSASRCEPISRRADSAPRSAGAKNHTEIASAATTTTPTST